MIQFSNSLQEHTKFENLGSSFFSYFPSFFFHLVTLYILFQRENRCTSKFTQFLYPLPAKASNNSNSPLLASMTLLSYSLLPFSMNFVIISYYSPQLPLLIHIQVCHTCVHSHITQDSVFGPFPVT